MMFQLLLFPVVLQSVVQIHGKVDYSCDLHWISEGYGNVPVASVIPSPGEFIARINLLEDDVWRIGRLIPEEGKALFVFLVENGEHVVHTSETYEVLANPDNCILEWIPLFGGDVPQYAIPSSRKKSLKEEFVGRGIVAGFAMVGGVHPSESALLVAYEGKVYPRRYYDVLTSCYPLLTMELYDFKFPILDFRVLEKNSKEMLIGQLELSSGLLEGDSATVVQPIVHSKNVKEVFKWEERQRWEGVANLTIDMDLWMGAPTVNAQFTDIHEQRKLGFNGKPKLVYDRIHPIVVDRTVTISGNRGANSALHGNYQVCSAATILQDIGVKFEALATVTAPGMNVDQIKEILRRTGRNILWDGVEDEDFVLVKIYGILRGSFVKGSSSHFGEVDASGACNSVLRKSKHAVTYSHL